MANNMPRVYIDSCCFLEVAQNPTTAGRENDVWFLQQLLRAAEARDIVVHTSVLTVAECQYVNGATDEAVQELFTQVLTSGHIVRIANPTLFTGERARDLYWKHKVKLSGADALHVASALENFTSSSVVPSRPRHSVGSWGRLPLPFDRT